MTILAVRHKPDSFSEPVLEPVATRRDQETLIRHLILDMGRQAEPVTLVPVQDLATLAKLRRDMVEDIVARFADDGDDNKALDVASRVAPGLRDTDGCAFFTALQDAAEAHRNWDGFDGRCLSEFEPEERDWDRLRKRYRELFDQELDALMTYLDSCGTQEAGDHTHTIHDEAKGAA